jgi:Rieske 2Fe-2S family protein
VSRFYRTAETLKLGSQTLPGRFFTSQAVFEAEIDRIYYSGWVYAGRTSQIDNAGDYFLFQCGGESVILLRDQSSEPRGFYNVCRHRGSRLCEAESGRFPHSIQCAYHAWTYGLDGQLIGAPLMDEVFEFRKEAHSLIPIAVADWEGFLFVNLAVQPEPFEDVFAPLAGKFNDWNLSQLENAGLIEYQVNANWKLIVQNYSECYHCPSIHPDLAKKSPYRSGKNDLFDGKFLGGYMDLAEGNGSLTLSGRACAPPLGSVNGEDLKRVYYYTIFPNMLLSLHPDYVMVHRLAGMSASSPSKASPQELTSRHLIPARRACWQPSTAKC